MSTAAPPEAFVVMTTFEATVGAGVMDPEIVIGDVPVYDAAFVVMVMVEVAAEAARGPRTNTAASRTVAIVLSVFNSITR